MQENTLKQREERRKEILRLRKPGPEKKTLREVAQIMKISPERVRQLEGGAHVLGAEKEAGKQHLKIYKFQQKFMAKHQRYAIMMEVVEAGLARDRFHLKRMYLKMQEKGMIEINPAPRGIRLLPLETAMEPETVGEEKEPV